MKSTFSSILRTLFLLLSLCLSGAAEASESTEAGKGVFHFGTAVNPRGETFYVDSRGILLNGEPILPVMGEIHYARVPQKDWRREIRKMKAGGVTIVASYIFWIHHEEHQGEWNWRGNRNLGEFVRICGEEGMMVVLRVGPFCHGECYNGGIPDWIVDLAFADRKEYGLRSTAPGFLRAVGELYNQIALQVKGQLWKDGGPIVGVQLENESAGPWSYLMSLKKLAVDAGLDVPFYTRTGWPNLRGAAAEFGQILPLYGDYADGFWDRSMNDMPGYGSSFEMKESRISSVIATETFSKDDLTDKGDTLLRSYPYLTCELGGGMTPSYHRRINISGNEMLPLLITKMGSGSNLPGYYMYHGGTNPYHAEHSMAETQTSRTTNANDMPHMSYEFQAPLGEMGQVNERSFHQSRWFHQFLADWGGELAVMDAEEITKNSSRRGCFEFHNDYVRILHEEGVAYMVPRGWRVAGLTIDSASVQPFCQEREGKLLYFITIPGREPRLTIDGKVYKPKLDKTIYVENAFGKKTGITVLSPEKAKRAFKIDGRLHYAKKGGVLYKAGSRVVEEVWQETTKYPVECSQKQQYSVVRQIQKGSAGAAKQPVEEDFLHASVWSITLSPDIQKKDVADDLFLKIAYQGDVARVYADGLLVEDNFWNGNPMMVRVSDLVGKQVELKILPLPQNDLIYLQAPYRDILKKSSGPLLNLEGITMVERCTF